MSSRSIFDYLYVTFIALTYGLAFLFRTSISPITDVIENEFNVTSSGVGMLSSSYYVAYVLSQTPWGLYLQIFTCESALIITTFTLSILSLIFPFTTGSLIFGLIIFFLVGLSTGVTFIVGLTIGGQKFGNNYVSLCGSIVLVTGTFHNFVGNIIQAYIYQKYQIWKPIYWAISILSFIYGIIFLICSFCENTSNKVSIRRNAATVADISTQELDNMQLSMCQQLKKTMLQTVKMYLNWLLGIILFCSGVIFFGTMGLWLLPYLMVKMNYSRSLSALISGLTFISSGIASVFIGIASKRFKRRKIFVYIGNILFLSFIIFIYVDAEYLSLGTVILLNILTGIAFPFFSPFLYTVCREYNWYYGNAETATGFVNMIMVSSGFIAQYTIGTLLDFHYESRDDADLDGNRNYTVDDYNFAFIIVPICLGIQIILTFFLKETHGNNIDYSNKGEKNQPTDHEYKNITRNVELSPSENKNMQ